MSVIGRSFARCNTADVADMACLSSKQLTRIFKEYVGLSPAEMIRIKRCNGVIVDIRKMAEGHSVALSDISAKLIVNSPDCENLARKDGYCI